MGIQGDKCMINKVIGIGGIGTGILFKLEGEHTLGRNESRLATLTNYKDYCKGHIIMHYVSKLSNVPCELWGKIGNDTQGEMLLEKMGSVNLKTDLIEISNVPTMFAVCFQYPDKSGGNITTSTSSCDLVDISYIENCLTKSIIDETTMVLAAPEVPLDTRLFLMKEATKKGAFVVASMLSGEVNEFDKKEGYKYCNLLAINEDEALSIADNIDATYIKVKEKNDKIKLVVTVGKNGAYIFENNKKTYIKAPNAKVVSTAGAGDAFLSGIMVGLIKGETLENATEIGNILSKFAIECKDTICDEVDICHIN